MKPKDQRSRSGKRASALPLARIVAGRFFFSMVAIELPMPWAIAASAFVVVLGEYEGHDERGAFVAAVEVDLYLRDITEISLGASLE